MTSMEKRIVRISDQLKEKQRGKVAIFYKDGTNSSADIVTVLAGVLAADSNMMERVECGPGCGILTNLINALLDPKE